MLALRHRPRFAAVLLAWIALPLVISLSRAAALPRHVMYLVPPVLVLAAYAIVEAGRFIATRLEPRRAGLASAVALALLLTPRWWPTHASSPTPTRCATPTATTCSS